MDIITLLLLLAGLVCFLLAAANVPVRFNAIGLGLAFWILVPLIDAVQHVH